jgi:hypothetical protein
VSLEGDRASSMVVDADDAGCHFVRLTASHPCPMRVASPCCEHEEETNSCGCVLTVRHTPAVCVCRLEALLRLDVGRALRVPIMEPLLSTVKRVDSLVPPARYGLRDEGEGAPIDTESILDGTHTCFV